MFAERPSADAAACGWKPNWRLIAVVRRALFSFFNTPMKTSPPTIPAGCEAFAKAAAALAEAHDIEKFEMSMKPKFTTDQVDLSRSLQGEIKVSFWQTDGRGRPSRNIRVRYEASIEIATEFTEESCS